MKKARLKRILQFHYNRKHFKDNSKDKQPVLKLNIYPRNRFEAAIYWGKGKGKALEIGAGSGQVLSHLKKYYDEYVATEFSVRRVEYLNKKFKDDSKIKIILNDIEDKNLGFPNNYFDTILMIAVIEHLIEPISVLKYCYFLLKPNGRLLINTPNIAKWTRRIKLAFGSFPSTASKNEGLLTYDNFQTELFDEGHLHYFTFRSLEKLLLEKIGFSNVKRYGFGDGFLSRIYPGLFSDCFVIAIK